MERMTILDSIEQYIIKVENKKRIIKENKQYEKFLELKNRFDKI